MTVTEFGRKTTLLSSVIVITAVSRRHHHHSENHFFPLNERWVAKSDRLPVALVQTSHRSSVAWIITWLFLLTDPLGRGRSPNALLKHISILSMIKVQDVKVEINRNLCWPHESVSNSDQMTIHVIKDQGEVQCACRKSLNQINPNHKTLRYCACVFCTALHSICPCLSTNLLEWTCNGSGVQTDSYLSTAD